MCIETLSQIRAIHYTSDVKFLGKPLLKKRTPKSTKQEVDENEEEGCWTSNNYNFHNYYDEVGTSSVLLTHDNVRNNESINSSSIEKNDNSTYYYSSQNDDAAASQNTDYYIDPNGVDFEPLFVGENNNAISFHCRRKSYKYNTSLIEKKTRRSHHKNYDANWIEDLENIILWLIHGLIKEETVKIC